MRLFPLKIVTADAVMFDGMAQSLTVRTTTGDMGILAGHANTVAALGMGRCTVDMDGERKIAACIGGMVSVMDGRVTLVPTTFEWAEQIDIARAERSETRAQSVLRSTNASKADITLAEARLKRALVRKYVASVK